MTDESSYWEPIQGHLSCAAITEDSVAGVPLAELIRIGTSVRDRQMALDGVSLEQLRAKNQAKRRRAYVKKVADAVGGAIFHEERRAGRRGKDSAGFDLQVEMAVDHVARKLCLMDLAVDPTKHRMFRAVLRATRDDPEEVLKMLNRRYAVVNMGGSVEIVHEHTDPATGHSVVDFIKPADLKLLYAADFVTVTDENGKPKSKTYFDHWYSHPRRRKFMGAVMVPAAPGEEPPTGGYFNMWRGWGIEPDPRGAEGCRLFLDHLKNVVCGGDEVLYEWLTAWLADAVQNPAERPGTSVAFQGGEGIGKGAVGDYVGRMYGPHYRYLDDGNALVGRFNKLLQNALLVFGDEVLFGGDRKAADKLKSMVTSKTINIEPKFVDAFPVRNNIRLMIASNAESMLTAGHDDRRWLILRVSGAHANDKAYFDAIYDEMDHGGPACLLHYLAHYTIPGEVNLRHAPATGAKGQQKAFSLSPAKRWWLSRLEDEYLTGSDEVYVWGDWIGPEPVTVAREALYAAFERDAVAAGRGRGRLPTPRQFWDEIGECMTGATFQMLKNKRRVADWDERGASAPTRVARLVLVAPLHECRAAFERWYGQPVEWPESTDMAAYWAEEEEQRARDQVM